METIANLEKQKVELQEELSTLSEYEKRIKAIRKEMHLIDKAVKQERVRQKHAPHIEFGKAFIDKVFKVEETDNTYEAYIIIKDISTSDDFCMCTVTYITIYNDFSTVESHKTLEHPCNISKMPKRILGVRNVIEATAEEITKCHNAISKTP